MSRFNRVTGQGVPPVRTATSPIKAGAIPVGLTHQGGTAYGRDEKSQLFMLGISNLVGQDTFYEKAEARDDRYRSLVVKVAKVDPWWVAEFARWLRRDQNLRTVAMITAAELAATWKGEQPKELRDYGWGHVGPIRYAVNGVLARADEPGELIGYWKSTYPDALMPKGLKRGIADAVGHLYTEYNHLKWDSGKSAVRFGDVVDLVHPEPKNTAQGTLFKYLIDDRHHRPDIDMIDVSRSMPMIYDNFIVRRRIAEGVHSDLLLDAGVVKDAGFTWEDVLSLGGQHGLSKKQLWESVIPSMGYMGTLRNLRNFLNAGVSTVAMDAVANKLQNPANVQQSRQLPMRFLSAHRATEGHPQWEMALSRALDLSMKNVPVLKGKTLILIDTSGSMNSRLSDKSDLMRWDAAVVFGLVVAARAEEATVVSFSAPGGNRFRGDAGHKVFTPGRNETLLRQISRWKEQGYFIGAGTDTIGAVQAYFNPTYSRVVIVTDEQVGRSYWHNRGMELKDVVPYTTPTYTWNLAGYEASHLPTGGQFHNWHAFGGLSDGSFKMIDLIESGIDADWPWEN